MDPVIANMERFSINIDNSEPVVPLVDRKVCRVKLAKAADRIGGCYLPVHVALRVFTCLMVMPLHG